MKKQIESSSILNLFAPLIALIAILVPMYTVTTIVNNYPFSNPHFSLLEWHGYEMLFGFFYTFVLFVLIKNISLDQKMKRLYFLILFLWLIDHAMVFLAPHFYLLLSSSIILWIIVLFYFFKKKSSQLVFLPLFFSALSILKLIYIYNAASGRFPFKFNLYDITMGVLILFAFLNLKKLNILPSVIKKITFLSLLGVIIAPIVQNPIFNIFVYGLSGIFSLSIFLYEESNKKLTGQEHFFSIGFLCISLSLILKSATEFFPALNYSQANLHFLFAGGLSILVINNLIKHMHVFHQQEFVMNKSLWTIQISLILGFLIRFIIPVFWQDQFIPSLHYSMGFWSLAFVVFFFKYFKLFFTKTQQ